MSSALDMVSAKARLHIVNKSKGGIKLITFICIVCVILLCIAFYRRKAKVEKYDYLEVLSYYHWRSGRKIRKKMERLKKGRVPRGEMYLMLSKLEDEGLIERRIRSKCVESFPIQVHQFRLKRRQVKGRS